MKSEGQNQTWVVKSSGRILGPYSHEELSAELRERNISIIDEARSHEKRWGFVREFPQFSEVVQFLRDQQSKTKEDTASIYLTQTKTITEPGLNDDLTPTPLILDSEHRPSLPRQVEAQEKVVHSPPSDKSYASSRDPILQKTIRQQKKTYGTIAWSVFGLVLLGLGLSFLQLKKDSPKSLNYEDYLRLAKYNKSIGSYDKSLQFFKKADAIKSLDVSSKLQMAPLMMVVENQNIGARQILENLKQTPAVEANLRNELELYTAISYMREGDLDRAESGLIQISNRDPANPYVQVNRNIIRILKGEYLGAYSEISTLLEKGVKDPVLLVLRALAAYQTFSVSDNRGKLEMSVQDLERYLKKNKDYVPESQLLIAAFEKKLGQNSEMEKTLKSLLNSSPTLTQEHIHSLQIDRQVLSWDYLIKVCDDVHRGFEQLPIATAMMSYCHFQRNEMGPAIDIYSKLRNQHSKDNSLLAFHAFLLYSMNRIDEAMAILKLPNALDSELSLEVEAQNCMNNKNFSCAEKYWNEILKIDAMSLKAITGLATIAYEKGQKELASDMLKRGMNVSDHYGPLVGLKDQIDAL